MHTRGFFKSVSISLLSLIVAGCTATPEEFILNSTSFSDTTVCRHFKHDGVRIPARFNYPADSADFEYLSILSREMNERKLDEEKCVELFYATRGDGYRSIDSQAKKQWQPLRN